MTITSVILTSRVAGCSTRDGLPDLCSALSFGSGRIDNRVIIYDYTNGANYNFQDQRVFDYTLRYSEDDRQLYVDKSSYFGGGVVASGRLVFEDDCLQILGQPMPSEVILKIINPTDNPNFAYDTTVEKIYEDENNEYFLRGLYSQYVTVH